MIVALFIGGCSTKNDRLFQTDKEDDISSSKSTHVTNIEHQNEMSYEYKISVNDRIEVNVYIKSNSDSLQMTPLLVNQSQNSLNTNISTQKTSGSLVNQKGMVTLPLLDSTKIIGLTEYEAANVLIEKYKRYVKNPFVTVKIINQRIIVIGEVKKPGVVPIINGTINLVDVIAQSGDFTDLAERTNIKIIRGNLRYPKVRIVDLTKLSNIMNGSMLLKPNDIVYVQSRNMKGWNKAITEIAPFFNTISAILNPFVQRKTLIQ